MKDYIENLQKQVISNYKQIKKLQRIVYLLENNIKVYRGKKGGVYYKTFKSKIYI
jgi:hypothetical protein